MKQNRHCIKEYENLRCKALKNMEKQNTSKEENANWRNVRLDTHDQPRRTRS